MAITVNGQPYDSWDALPAAVREQLSRAGRPDVDHDPVDARTVIEVNGRAYTSMDDLRAEIRATLEDALCGLLGRHPEPPVAPLAPTPSIPVQRGGNRPARDRVVLDTVEIDTDEIDTDVAAQTRPRGLLRRLLGH